MPLPETRQQQQYLMVGSYTTQSANYQPRTVTRNGRRYMVAPVAMMTEGVHNGSHGPVLHLNEELERSADKWNGTPVTAYHPRQEGNYISASTEQGRRADSIF